MTYVTFLAWPDLIRVVTIAKSRNNNKANGRYFLKKKVTKVNVEWADSVPDSMDNLPPNLTDMNMVILDMTPS